MSNSLNHANSLSGAAPSPQLATPESDADVSAALRERFDIVSKLAESDTHFLYSARDLSSSGATGLIRLNVLRTSLAGDNRQVELFRLEASAAARLSHGNILKSTEAEEFNGIHFYIMEERPGVITLRDHLDRRGWLNIDEAVQISRQIADALQHAHSRGILHLTLEPEKVLLDHEGTTYVTGFGIARAKDLLWARQERSRHCAARYVTPEQILSGEVDQRTDLYLLGLILFEMLTDRAPFESEDPSALRSKHLARTPAPPHTFRPELSRELSQTVQDLLNKRPDGRPFYVSAFKSALERCIAAGLINHEQDEGAEEDEDAEESVAFREPDPSFEGPGSPAPPATSEGGEQNSEADELANMGGAAVAINAAVEINEEFKDSDSFYQQDSTDAGYLEEFPEPDDGSQPHRDVIEIPLQSTREYQQDESYEQDKFYEQDESYEPGESIATVPVVLAEGPGRVRHGRLVWLLALLLFGGGAFLAIRAARFQGESNLSAVTSLQSNDAPSALNEEVSAPKADPVTPGTAEKLPPGSALANLVTEDALTDVEKRERVTTDKVKPTDKIEAEELSPPKRAKNIPPDISSVGPAFTPKADLPAKFKEYATDDAQPREPAPAPQQPANPPAPKTIRKSGDVLQNTAIIRPKPFYPKAARASGEKGAVTVEVTIDEEGSVIAARPISGPEQLRDAALAAARRWKWVPERVDRTRARVVGTITLSFKD